MRPAIALDYSPALHQSAGIGRYAREIAAALLALRPDLDWRYFVMGADHRVLPELPPGVEVRPSRLSERTHHRLWRRLRLPLPVETWTGPIDLFHGLDFLLPPLRPATRSVVTIHDLSYERFPAETMPGMLDTLRFWTPRAVARADCVVAVSEWTRQDLIELYRLPPEKVIAIPHGVHPRFGPAAQPGERRALRQRYGLPEGVPLLLTVGTTQPRKNHLRLVRAFAQLHTEAHLVIAGGRGWYYEDVFREVERLGLRERVTFTSFVEEIDLPALYRAATVFAYPALYEGFGLPVLEAMACGVAVLCANSSSLPEVLGPDGEAGLLVDPLDVEAIAAGLARLLADDSLRTRMGQAGQARAAGFTWEAAAQAHLRIYGDLLASSSGRGRAIK